MRFAIAAAILFLVPVSSAQAPQAAYIVTFTPDSQTLILDDEGRGDAPFSVRVTPVGVTCVTPAQLRLSLVLEGFPTFAGASIQPPAATWDMGPGPVGQTDESQHVVYTAWDIESAPDNATPTYEIRVAGMTIEGGPCTPSPGPGFPSNQRTPTVLVCLPESRGGPNGEECEFEDAGETTATFDGTGRVPMPTPAWILLSLAVGALLVRPSERTTGPRRRRRNGRP